MGRGCGEKRGGGGGGGKQNLNPIYKKAHSSTTFYMHTPFLDKSLQHLSDCGISAESKYMLMQETTMLSLNTTWHRVSTSYSATSGFFPSTTKPSDCDLFDVKFDVPTVVNFAVFRFKKPRILLYA